MEFLERYSLRVALAIALSIFAIMSAGITFTASPREASIGAALQRTPVVVSLRLELDHGCLTLAVLASLRQGSAGRNASMDESAPYSAVCRFGEWARHQRID
ncbi:MAG: hypothetical protein WCC26_17080 [Terracidiphilus sp.]